MKTLLLLLLLAAPATAQDDRASKGSVVIYIENRQDRRHMGDFVMDTGLAYLKTRFEARLSAVLPSARYRVFTGADYLSGDMPRYFEAVASDPQNGPVDVITLSHSGGDSVETPFGGQNFGEFFQQVPKALEPRLRLFYNAGCYGAYAYKSAFKKGFKLSVGTERMSIGPVALDEFLKHYLQGDSAVEAARRVNAVVAGGADWTVPFLMYKVGTRDRSSQAEYAERSSLKVYTPERELPTLSEPEGELLPDPLKRVTVRSVLKRGEDLKSLPTRLSVDFDGSVPYLPDDVEIDVSHFDVTKTRFAPIRLLDNTVIAYERATDRGVQHEIEALHIEVPLPSYSVGGEGILARIAAQADLEVGFRHRHDQNTGYAQLHGRIETLLEVARTVSLVARAEIWAMVENLGLRVDAELTAGAQVRLNDQGARLEAGYSRFYSDIFNKRSGGKDDFDAALIGVTLGR